MTNRKKEIPELPEPDSDVQGKKEQAALEEGAPLSQAEREMGYIGRFIGCGSEKSGNIALFVIASSVVLILVFVVIAANSSDGNTSDKLYGFITGLISLISGALGYIFGSSSNKD